MAIKQVIVMRHDLGMRRGKQIAQGSHASMAFLCEKLRNAMCERSDRQLNVDALSSVVREWLLGLFTKVCCRVDSEQELMDIFDKAKEAGLMVHLIVDSGKTEFKGVPTPTYLAIGPDYSEKIDPITSHLKLL